MKLFEDVAKTLRVVSRISLILGILELIPGVILFLIGLLSDDDFLIPGGALLGVAIGAIFFSILMYAAADALETLHRIEHNTRVKPQAAAQPADARPIAAQPTAQTAAPASHASAKDPRESTYANLMKQLKQTASPEDYMALAEEFRQLGDYADAAAQSAACAEKAACWGTVTVEFPKAVRDDGFQIFIDNTPHPFHMPQANTTVSIAVCAGRHTFSVGTYSGYRSIKTDFDLIAGETVRFSVQSGLSAYLIQKL
ncbi:MAG: hypothetical protein IK080_02075 [Clostridia bacterium]|nr:hypothetical protein [Clostridia bacterium]